MLLANHPACAAWPWPPHPGAAAATLLDLLSPWPLRPPRCAPLSPPPLKYLAGPSLSHGPPLAGSAGGRPHHSLTHPPCPMLYLLACAYFSQTQAHKGEKSHTPPAAGCRRRIPPPYLQADAEQEDEGPAGGPRRATHPGRHVDRGPSGGGRLHAQCRMHVCVSLRGVTGRGARHQRGRRGLWANTQAAV